MADSKIRRVPLIWAHRGASRRYPENTLSAFQGAIDAGADGIELDVHLSADGQLVVTHDEDTRRVTGVPGKIAAMTLAEIRRLNFAAFRPDAGFETAPTLEEVFDLVAPTRLTLNLELKNSIEAYPGLEEKVIELAEVRGMNDRVLYSSFNHDSMAKVRRINPAAQVGLLYVYLSRGVFRRAKEIGAAAVHPHWRLAAFAAYTAFCRRCGLDVHVWTVDSEFGLRACCRAEVAAVITNDPAYAAQVFAPINGREGS